MPTSRAARLTEIDLLRFVAAAAVLAFHFVELKAWGGVEFAGLRKVSVLGVYGVQLFFMISGFVILMSVWGRTAGEFAVSRVARLYPAYWLSVGVLGVPALTGLYGPGLKPWEILANLTMVQQGLRIPDLGVVYWTLWAELRFYLLIGLFALVGVTYRRCVIFLSAWLFLALTATATKSALLEFLFMPWCAHYFIAGMALYLVHRFGSSAVPWALVGFCWILAVVRAVTEGGVRVREYVGQAAGPYLIIGVLTAIFVTMGLLALGRLAWLRRRPALATLGALTYPLYLLHHPVGALLVAPLAPLLPKGVVLAVAVTAALLVAHTVSRWFEPWAMGRLRTALTASLAAIRRENEIPEDGTRMIELPSKVRA
ncbi:acyltransferase [Streptosporangium sp. NPDC006007]|uniref:acyltransferase family protein n=1 Tax=Streptosporangium sp. NPDC006007 TaxID=3154575 RepID=UPI0033A8511D